MKKKSLKALITLLFTLIFMAVSVVGLGVYGARGSTLLTPHEVVLSNSHNGIIIKWNKKVGVKGYYVYRWDGQKKEKIATITDSEKNSFYDKAVESGNKYFYSVSAVYQKKESAESERCGIIRLETPLITSTDNVSGGILIQWKSCVGAEGYTVFRNLGKENVEIRDEICPAYKVSFTFTGEGGKKTSDDMWAWISADTDHIPLKLEGKLPVGKVQCFYVK